MALRASITAIDASADSTKLTVSVSYFDTGAPTVIIDGASFDFPVNVSAATVQTAIQSYGASLRTRLSTRASKAQQFVGTVVDIP